MEKRGLGVIFGAFLLLVLVGTVTAANFTTPYAYVAGEGSSTVTQFYSGNGSSAFNFTTLGGPEGVAVDSSGNVWISYNGMADISFINTTSYVVTNYSIAGGTYRGIALDNQGYVWVADQSSKTVNKFYPQNASLILSAPAFTNVQGVAGDLLGNIWVSSGGWISKINASTGISIANYSMSGTSASGIAADTLEASPTVWASDTSTNTLSELNVTSGQVVANITVGPTPTGVTIDSNHNIWVSVFSASLTIELNATGTVIGNFTTIPGNQPEGVSVTNDGNIWFASRSGISNNTIRLNGTTGQNNGNFTASATAWSDGDFTGFYYNVYVLNNSGSNPSPPGVNNSYANFNVTNAGNSTVLSSWSLTAFNGTYQANFTNSNNPIQNTSFPLGTNTLNFTSPGYGWVLATLSPFTANQTVNVGIWPNIQLTMGVFNTSRGGALSNAFYNFGFTVYPTSPYSVAFGTTPSFVCNNQTSNSYPGDINYPANCTIFVGNSTPSSTTLVQGFEYQTSTRVSTTVDYTLTGEATVNFQKGQSLYLLSTANNTQTIYAYDQLTNASISPVNFTLSGNYSYSKVSVNTPITFYFDNDPSTIWPQGGTSALSLVDAAGNYEPATTSLFFDNYTSGTYNVYPIAKSVSQLVGFKIINGFTGGALQGALVTVETQLSGSTNYTLIGSLLSGSDGVAAFYLYSPKQYRINASYAGYGNSSLITPVDTLYTVSINVPQNISYSYSFANVIFNMLPNRVLYQPVENITWIVTAIGNSSSIIWFALNLSYSNGTSFFYENLSNSSIGGWITGSVNVTGFELSNQTNLTATGYFAQQGVAGVSFFSQVYSIGNYASFSGGIAGAGAALGSAGLSPITLFLSAMIIALLIAGYVAKRSSTMAGGGAAILILGVFSYVGWIDIRLFLVGLIGLIGIAVFQKGVR